MWTLGRRKRPTSGRMRRGQGGRSGGWLLGWWGWSGGTRSRLPSAGDEGPAVVSLQPVVMPAQTVQVVQDAVVGVGPPDPMVDFGQRPGLVTSDPAAGRLGPRQRHLLRPRRASTQVDDGGDVL